MSDLPKGALASNDPKIYHESSVNDQRFHCSMRLARQLIAGLLFAWALNVGAAGNNSADNSSASTNQTPKDLHGIASRYFERLPGSMPGSHEDTPAKIQLGERLYFETALSFNRSQSCNTCHNLLNGGAGTDNRSTSPGAGGNNGTRNSPSTWNAGLQFAQFWDARVATLEQQAEHPILNPAEMGLETKSQAIERLRALDYQQLFAQAYPQHEEPLNFPNLVAALASFQRTLISQDRFDTYLGGDLNALSPLEQRGLQLFIWTGCNGCHNGPLLGGDSIMKLGVVHPYPNGQDTGRAQVTGERGKRFFFKVPPLRNVGLTAPYFHDGAVSRLEQAVSDTAWHQLGVRMSSEDAGAISAFLRSLDNLRAFTPDNARSR